MVYSINNTLKKKLYKSIFRIRSVEFEISRRYSAGKMRCPTHLSIGQEAVAAAFAEATLKMDFAVSTHRGHAHYLAKGGNLKKMLAEIYGKKTGCSNGKGGSMHLNDTSVNFMGTSAIVGNSIPIGVGLGLSAKIKKTKQISFVFMGDGAIEEGVFFESINFAVLKKLPVIFICENNLYSVYSHLNVRQPKKRSISKMVKAMGIQTLKSDGNDVITVYKKLKSAIKHVRTGKGPFFLEFFTHRWLEHCGPNFDDHLGYRNKKSVDNWLKRDPLKVLLKKIDKKKLSEISKINHDVKKEIMAAFKFAEKSPLPKQSDAFKGLFKDR